MATQMTEKEAVMQGIAEASQTLDRVRNKILERINNLIKNPSARFTHPDNPSARFTHPDISETDKLMEGIVKAYDILEKANERLTQRIYLYQGIPISEIPPPMMQSQLHSAPEEEGTPISEIPPPMMQSQLHSAPEEEPYMYYPGNATPKSQPYMYYPGNATPKSQGIPISEIPPPMMQPQLHSAPEEEEEPEMTQSAEGDLSCQACMYYPGNASQKSQIEMKVEEIEARVEMLENLRRQAAGQSWAVTTRQWG